MGAAGLVGRRPALPGSRSRSRCGFVTLGTDSRRRPAARLQEDHPGALFLDVTSRGDEPWVAFSPGVTSQSVEGVWQALKVFASADVDPSKLAVTTMKGIKRSVRRNGPV